MSELDSRLIRCFASVFPGLMAEEIRASSMESGEQWDSLAAVTLAAVVQEEFNVEIDSDELSELNSFEAFRAFLDRDSLERGRRRQS